MNATLLDFLRPTKTAIVNAKLLWDTSPTETAGVNALAD